MACNPVYFEKETFHCDEKLITYLHTIETTALQTETKKDDCTTRNVRLGNRNDFAVRMDERSQMLITLFALLGIVGDICLLITLHGVKEFREVGFLYHRLIAALDLDVNVGFLFIGLVRSVLALRLSYYQCSTMIANVVHTLASKDLFAYLHAHTDSQHSPSCLISQLYCNSCVED